MANGQTKTVGGLLMRVLGVLLVVVGVLGALASLTQGNVVGMVLGVVLVAGGAVLLKRSGRAGRSGAVASTR
ncbi:hypothetical protein [Micromonospora wenchangensis]|uniref:Uncharacterized protein n=1 Tax=Micromonospora wenchangensis TaxID=1185415 RepID=A0A246RGY5_9ACTN|nr:hypothetical protein [Micromonospora wenchangensis]OWV03256.1 hypothetical protein B5D80_23320 [Micromonospora wenchangensis]